MYMPSDRPSPANGRPGPKPRGRSVLPLTITVTPAPRPTLGALARECIAIGLAAATDAR
jgi:hypothetical protein